MKLGHEAAAGIARAQRATVKDVYSQHTQPATLPHSLSRRREFSFLPHAATRALLPTGC
jgi:hypothetical protein